MRCFIPSYRLWQVVAAVRARQIGQQSDFDFLEWVRRKVQALLGLRHP